MQFTHDLTWETLTCGRLRSVRPGAHGSGSLGLSHRWPWQITCDDPDLWTALTKHGLKMTQLGALVGPDGWTSGTALWCIIVRSFSLTTTLTKWLDYSFEQYWRLSPCSHTNTEHQPIWTPSPHPPPFLDLIRRASVLTQIHIHSSPWTSKF